VHPKISVVIRIRNEAAALATTLRALSVQNHHITDIVVVNNASTDGSRKVAESFGARILDMPREEFTFGRALNRGLDAAQAEYVVVLSAHAVPLGRSFLDRVVEPFKDPRVAGVRCLHVGNRRELSSWMEPRLLDSESPLESVVRYGPTAAAGAFRKSVWQTIPFDEEVASVEDKLWALQALQHGYLLANSEAMYIYTRDFHFFEKIKRMNRQRVELFRKTGVLWQEPPVTLKHVLVSALHDVPKRGIRTAALELMLYLHFKTIPLQARRKQKIGSVR
jgi:rhamnosyltransferase